MDYAEFEDFCRYVGFDGVAAARVAQLAAYVSPQTNRIVDVFYAILEKNPKALAVFTGGRQQIQKQKIRLAGWVDELFDGTYGQSYFENRLRIGQAHVRVGLPQHYMVAGMEVVRSEIGDILRENKIPARDERVLALMKLLSVELAIMLGSYKESHTARIRENERDAVEAKLTRAEHLAKLGQLAVSLAHEIKNPLAGISGAIQVIRESLGKDHEHAHIMHEVLAQIMRLDDVVKDLLLYARPNSPRFESCDLDHVVRSTLVLMREEPAAQNVDIAYTPVDQPVRLEADPAKMGQLMINLIINAVDACRHTGRVTVDMQVRTDVISMTITDTGQGMNATTLDRAFEPFFTCKPKGTGLGLSICKSIVDAHAGSIQITSEVGDGTRVSILLPRQQESPDSRH